MVDSDFIIREIQPIDNEQVKNIIKHVILQMGAPKVGTAYQDKALEDMYNAYQTANAVYYVVESKGKVLGGGGIAQLDHFGGNTCELQKMYFLDEIRGMGLGTRMIKKCLNKAKKFGFKQCYLETMPFMRAAQKLYKKNGFKYLDGPLGNTSHHFCDVWMLREL